MTTEEAKRRAELYSALAEGKTIQILNMDGNWVDVEVKKLNYIPETIKFRIKPEPKFRPFRNTEECWQEMLKHQPFGWLRRNDTGAFAHISAVFPDFILFSSEKFIHKESFECYTFIDGTPFGIKEE